MQSFKFKEKSKVQMLALKKTKNPFISFYEVEGGMDYNIPFQAKL